MESFSISEIKAKYGNKRKIFKRKLKWQIIIFFIEKGTYIWLLFTNKWILYKKLKLKGVFLKKYSSNFSCPFLSELFMLLITEERHSALDILFINKFINSVNKFHWVPLMSWHCFIFEMPNIVGHGLVE